MDFLKQCRADIERMEGRTLLKQNGDYYKLSNIKNLKNAADKLAVYLDERGVYLASQINYQFTQDYRLWLINKNLAKNTISNHMSKLKFWIRRFHILGLMEYSGVGIITSQELTTSVIHTTSELKELYKLKLPKSQKKVIDIYICQCFLGLRISDMFVLLTKIKQSK